MANNAVTYPGANAVPPIVVDLGKEKRSRIKALKRGSGKLMQEVRNATNEVLASLGPAADGREVIPIVFIYRKKERRRNPFAF